MMSSRNINRDPLKKPDNIIWIEEVILNNLEESGIVGASVPNTSTVPSEHNLARSNGHSHIEGVGGLSREMMRSKASSVVPKDISPTQPRSKQSISTSASEHTQASSELKIGIAEIELKDESYLGDDRVQTLSRIVTGKIKYFIENHKDYEDEERYQYWIIKLPNLVNPNRNLSQQMDVARREITFYTEILPSMKSWLGSQTPSPNIEFKVPTCFYGKYLRPIDPEVQLDIITHILDSESILVLDDLRTAGFGKRHFASGLLISEAVSTLNEIVKFHVTSWAMEKTDRKAVHRLWSHLYDWENLAHLYHGLLETQFSNLQKFLHDTRHPKAHDIFIKLVKMRPHLLNKLFNLLAPAEHSGPNTLIHMDLWSENILFRMSDQDKEDEVSVEEADLDCCILDWQLVSYGKPTHDLALLTMLSMEPSYRREHATWLLQIYYQLFEKHASYFGLEMPFDFETLKQEYKQSCVLATFMAMASIEIVKMEETTQNRLLEALLDLINDKLI